MFWCLTLFKVPFPGFSSHSDSILPRFQLGKCFLLLKIYLLWKIWPISVKRWKPVWIRACLHYHYFLKLQQHKQRHKGKLQPASGSNNNCWSVCHTGFHRKQGLEKGALMPHSCSFFTTITHPAIFFIVFPNSWCFVPKNNKLKSKNCKGKIIDFVSRQTSFNMHLVDSRLQLIHMVSRIPHKQAKNPASHA